MRLWFVAWGTGPDPRRDNYETAGAPVQARAVPDGFDFSAASTRSGVKGTWRSRTPTLRSTGNRGPNNPKRRSFLDH